MEKSLPDTKDFQNSRGDLLNKLVMETLHEPMLFAADAVVSFCIPEAALTHGE